MATPKLRKLRDKLSSSKETLDMYDDTTDEVESYECSPNLTESQIQKILEDAQRQEEEALRRLEEQELAPDEDELDSDEPDSNEPVELEDLSQSTGPAEDSSAPEIGNVVTGERDGRAVLWELEEKNGIFRKGDCRKGTVTLAPGRYQLVVTKVDRSITRTVDIEVQVVQGGQVTKTCQGSVGLATTQHCIDLKLSSPSTLHIKLLCTSSLLGTVQIEAFLYQGCVIVPGKQSAEGTQKLPEDEGDAIDEDDADDDGEDSEDESDIVAEMISKPISPNTVRTMTATLEAGWYSIGVMNVDKRVGYRKIEGAVRIRKNGKDITRSIRRIEEPREVPPTVDAEEEAAEQNPPEKAQEFGFLDLRYGELPWRVQFFVPPEQAPVEFELRVTKRTMSAWSSRLSARLRRVPDPHSMGEIYKRTRSTQINAFLLVALMLLISYGSQALAFILALQIPFTNITVRLIVTVLALAWGTYHREEILAKMRGTQERISSQMTFFKKLDTLDGLDKLMYMQERSKLKKKKRRAARLSMMVV